MNLMKTIFATAVVLMANPLYADDKNWSKVGSGEYHFLFWHAYDTALFAPNGTYDANKPYALENTYHMNFDQDELIDRTFEEMQRHGTFSKAEQSNWNEQLTKLWPDVKEGDRIRAEVMPEKQVTFYVNDAKTGSIKGQKFAKLFPAIWLGENTSGPDLRKALLAKK